jgi:citrate lyase beta subunit
MLKSFFYIPAGNKKFFSALNKYRPDYFVIDLEDSISSNILNEAIDFVIEEEFMVDIPLYIRLWDFNSEIVINNKRLFEKFSNFVLPKVESINQIKVFISSLSDLYKNKNFKFILLFESPEGILNIDKILEIFKRNLTGIGFGSHDYCNKIGALHDPLYFSFPRNLLLIHGKKYNLMCIDIASANIKDDEAFINECVEGFNLGFDAKPILHPHQLDLLHKAKYFSDLEIREAEELFLLYKGFIPNDISALKFNGKIIEKPHIKRINNIINYINKHKNNFL